MVTINRETSLTLDWVCWMKHGYDAGGSEGAGDCTVLYYTVLGMLGDGDGGSEDAGD